VDLICIPYFSSVPRENFSPPPARQWWVEKFSLGTLEKYGIGIKSAHDTGTEGHTIEELKDISHAVAAIKITMLHRVYLNMIRRAELCIDAGGNHLQHLP